MPQSGDTECAAICANTRTGPSEKGAGAFSVRQLRRAMSRLLRMDHFAQWLPEYATCKTAPQIVRAVPCPRSPAVGARSFKVQAPRTFVLFAPACAPLRHLVPTTTRSTPHDPRNDKRSGIKIVYWIRTCTHHGSLRSRLVVVRSPKNFLRIPTGLPRVEEFALQSPPGKVLATVAIRHYSLRNFERTAR